MKKTLIYIALLLTIVAQGAWAYNPHTMKNKPTEGPWTYNAAKCGTSFNKGGVSFNGLNGDAWVAQWDGGPNWKRAYQWQDDDGTGFSMHCRAGNFMNGDYYGVYSTYSHSETVEPYTVKRLTWNFQLKGLTHYAPQTTALYARNDLNALKNTNVDYSDNYSNKSGKAYCIAYLVQNNDPNRPNTRVNETAQLTKTFDFDNSEVDTARTITWSIMLTHVVHNTITATYDMHAWGSFKHIDASWQTIYYRKVTFNANGGSGSMSNQKIEGTKNLNSNAFTRPGFTFAGWATAPDGEVVYADKAAITADASHKGPVTLYAVWNAVAYTISYNLNGGSADNPTSYTFDTPTFTLAYPTKTDSTFIGWTEGYFDDPIMDVTIEQGSMGNRSFTANWINTAVLGVRTLINAIGDVEYTAESKAKIDAARTAYDALSDKKTMLTAAELETLQAAEATYAALAPSTIEFKEKDGETTVNSNEKAIYYPELPAGTTHWQTVEKNVSEDKTIVIKAVNE